MTLLTGLPVIKAPLAGFEHINRYWDPVRQTVSAKLHPGEYYVTNQPENLVTTLGSCIAVCLWDPQAGVGGMNHFMLPGSCDPKDIDFTKPNDATRYGSYAMEHLVNAILQYGGVRSRLLVKIAGGGRVLRNATDVGARNIAFIMEYIRTERLQMVISMWGASGPENSVFNPEPARPRSRNCANWRTRPSLTGRPDTPPKCATTCASVRSNSSISPQRNEKDQSTGGR
jgi:chemotaxis protein CheD